MNWTHIIIEAYCTRTWSTKKSKYYYEAVDLLKGKFKKVLNTSYDPNYKTPKKPSFCPNSPRYICLERNCPHLGYTDALKEDYKAVFRRYSSKNKKRKRN